MGSGAHHARDQGVIDVAAQVHEAEIEEFLLPREAARHLAGRLPVGVCRRAAPASG
jgi:hypothetical protein